MGWNHALRCHLIRGLALAAGMGAPAWGQDGLARPCGPTDLPAIWYSRPELAPPATVTFRIVQVQ